MPSNPDNPKQQDSLLWSLGLPLFFCTLGTIGVLLFLLQKDRWDCTAEQTRTDLRHIPPEWIGYRQTAVFATPMPGTPTCFALLEESTFVVGSVDPPMLSLFDGTGTLLRTIDLPEEPRAIACATAETIFSGKIIVAHPKSIVVYSAEGQSETSWELPNVQSDIRSLVLTPNFFFAADTGNRCLYRFNVNVPFDLKFGTDFVVFAAPITMTFSPLDGFLYVANPGRHQVEVFTQDGVYQPDLCWGEPSIKLESFTACCNPVGLAVLDDGRILTVEKGISRIKIYRTDGTLDSVVAGPDVLDTLPPEFGRSPMEPGGRYFSAVPLATGRIAVFDLTGMIRIFAPL